MKKFIFQFIMIPVLLLTGSSLYAQTITGTWYSRDGSRQYSINQKDESWEAILVRSEREGETGGKLILEHLQPKGKKKYRGIIYAVDDNISTIVTLRTSTKDSNVLVLRLKRMLAMTVTIRWYRNPA